MLIISLECLKYGVVVNSETVMASKRYLAPDSFLVFESDLEDENAIRNVFHSSVLTSPPSDMSVGPLRGFAVVRSPP